MGNFDEGLVCVKHKDDRAATAAAFAAAAADDEQQQQQQRQQQLGREYLACANLAIANLCSCACQCVHVRAYCAV